MLRSTLSFLFASLTTWVAAQSSGSMSTECKSPTCSTLPAQYFTSEGSKRVAIQYGPYTTPPRTMMSGMKDFEEDSVEMPCMDCLITWMKADLHYVNGTEANANTGLWLHHTLLANVADRSPACGGSAVRFFASGNERTAADICVNGTDQAGYYVSSDAQFAMVTELMNMADEPASSYVTITYEYISNPTDSFARVHPVWLDISGGCGNSEMPAYANKSFQYTSPSWEAPSDGKVTLVISHLHDGGVHLETKNGNDVVCNAVATYGGNPAYVETMMMNMTKNGMQMEMPMTMDHISSLTACTNKGSMVKGDKWSVTAYYNTNEYAPMTDTNGTLEPIMGIALMYYVEGKSVNMTSVSSTSSGSAPASTNAASGVSTSGRWMIGVAVAAVVLSLLIVDAA